MPTYSYECGSCAHVFDVFHGMSADPKIKCEKCKKKCHRLFGTGAGIIFKGSGFYETDFKEKKGKAPDAPKSDSAKTDSPKSEKAKSEKSEGTGTSKKDSSAKKSDGNTNSGGEKKKASNS